MIFVNMVMKIYLTIFNKTYTIQLVLVPFFLILNFFYLLINIVINPLTFLVGFFIPDFRQ
ncbi:hypothetical protein EHW40_22015, partial [Salmonella enterica]|nr:hypothetical protein [Salmonella enterica]